MCGRNGVVVYSYVSVSSFFQTLSNSFFWALWCSIIISDCSCISIRLLIHMYIHTARGDCGNESRKHNCSANSATVKVSSQYFKVLAVFSYSL